MKMQITTEIIEQILKEQNEREKQVAEYYRRNPYCLTCPQNETPAFGCCKCAR